MLIGRANSGAELLPEFTASVKLPRQSFRRTERRRIVLECGDAEPP